MEQQKKQINDIIIQTRAVRRHMFYTYFEFIFINITLFIFTNN